MTGTNKLKKIIEKHDGIITTSLVEENNIHREYLGELVREGQLERVGHGIYITPDVWEDQLYFTKLKRSK